MTSAELRLLQTKRTLLVSGLFDPAFYRETYADLRSSTVDPLTHYVTHGEAEGRSPNAVFFPRYYRRQAMQEAPEERNALAHYAEEGERLGRKPNPAFEPRAYLAANPPLAEFVDRPLFHYLKIGRRAGLPVAPGPHGEALARVLAAQPHATDFEGSGRRNHYQLMRYKQALVRELGIEEGFAFYREAVGLPDSDRIEKKPVTSLYEFAREHGAAFYEIAPGGEPFAMPPPHVIGDGNHETLEGISRAVFTALIDARVRARSGFIEVEDKALLDYQGEELARIDDELDFDPAVFHARDGAVWMIEPDPNGATIELDEAFMLLGPHSDGFGHWMLDLLPRYIAASASGALPQVPVLIDASMAETQRQCLELMLPESVEVIALPAFATARVRRLWCAASQMHVPLSAGRGDPPNPGCFAAPPARFTETVREMVRRIEPIAAIATRQDKVYLAGSGQGHAALLNAAEIEAAAVARGFAIVHPDDLSFAEQVRQIRNAKFIVMSEAGQVLLSLFAKPGTRLCCLLPDGAAPGLPLRLLDELDVDFTVLNGQLAQPDAYPDTSGYRIDLAAFRESLDCGLGGERQLPNSAQEELEYFLRLSASVPGFARREEARELARVSFSLPPNAIVVEIGSFLGSGTILLAGARKIRGSGKVHAVDPFDGSGDPVSVPIYEKILAEAGGGSLRGHFDANIRRAGLGDWIEAHQGRATEVAAHWTTPVDMIFFDGDQSRAGVREAYESWSPFLKSGGVIVIHNSAPNHRPDQDGSRCLVQEEIRPPDYEDIRLVYSATFARKAEGSGWPMFSYWDKPDLTPIRATLDDWQSYFPNFTIFGDPDVEPIIEELFPQHLELFRNIRIPTCKSDIALLLLLYKLGGLYVDCHCGVRDSEAIRQLVSSLDQWELILYDKNRQEAPRAATELYPLNSVLIARPHSSIIHAAAEAAFANLAAHRSIEKERGFRCYHIATLSGPQIFSDVLFLDPDGQISVLKPEWEGRVRFLEEGVNEPIGRYMHYGYRVPGMHWSERQRRKLLFG